MRWSNLATGPEKLATTALGIDIDLDGDFAETDTAGDDYAIDKTSAPALDVGSLLLVAGGLLAILLLVVRRLA